MSARRNDSPLDAAIREVVRAELEAREREAPSWGWVPASAVFPTSKAPSRALVRLARREKLRLTRIAGEAYVHRGDLDAHVEANRCTEPAPSNDQGDDVQGTLRALAEWGRK